MAVHSLEGCGEDPLFRRGNKEMMAIRLRHYPAADETPGEFDMFARLAQSPNVDLHRLGQAGKSEVPFVSEAVTPAARFYLGLEYVLEYVKYVSAVSRGKKVEIIAQVGPVVERLHDQGRASVFFERGAHVLQMVECVGNPGALLDQHAHRPALCLQVAGVSGNAIEHLKSADNYVVGVSQIAEVRSLLGRECDDIGKHVRRCGRS